MNQGRILALTGRASKRDPNDDLRDYRVPIDGVNTVDTVKFTTVGEAYAELDQFNDAWRCIGEAMTAVETTKQKLSEAEVYARRAKSR